MNAPETSWKIPSVLSLTTVPTVFRPQRALHKRPRELTLQNAECGVTLNVGEKFELELGLLNVTVRVGDESVLSAEGGGVLQALTYGKTKVYVTGELLNLRAGAMHVPRKLLIEIPVTVI